MTKSMLPVSNHSNTWILCLLCKQRFSFWVDSWNIWFLFPCRYLWINFFSVWQFPVFFPRRLPILVGSKLMFPPGHLKIQVNHTAIGLLTVFGILQILQNQPLVLSSITPRESWANYGITGGWTYYLSMRGLNLGHLGALSLSLNWHSFKYLWTLNSVVNLNWVNMNYSDTDM